MANTIAIQQTHPITPKFAHIGMVKVSVVTTDTYTTPTGFSVDFSAILTALGIAFSDVVDIDGTTLTGHTVTPIKTATAGTFTIRLWNGATEIANGALTQTLALRVWYTQGAKP